MCNRNEPFSLIPAKLQGNVSRSYRKERKSYTVKEAEKETFSSRTRPQMEKRLEKEMRNLLDATEKPLKTRAGI